MKKMFLFAACLAVLACSCSENEEGTVKDVRASLKINANIGAPLYVHTGLWSRRQVRR